MAGIGFELQRMIDSGQGLLGRVRGYATAGLISSGPWIMTIVTLSAVSLLAPAISEREEYELFRGIVTYCFCFSLIAIAPLQMTVTRRVADLLYQEQYDRVLPAFNACVITVGLVQIVTGSLFCWLAELPPAISFVSVGLYTVIGVLWLVLIWLGVTREYDEVLRAYVLGGTTTVIWTFALGNHASALELVTAYAAGQALTLVFLMRTVVRGMEAGGDREFTVLQAVRLFPRIVMVGVAYNCAIWIDKIIFWFVDGTGAHPWVRFHPLYDSCTFLAYLTAIPALAVNLVRVETSFYVRYRAYYGAILGGLPLEEIADRRKKLFQNMWEATVHLVRIQGAITALAIIFAPQIIESVGLPYVAIRVFRASCLGAFFHVMLLVTLLMQMYFELRKEAFLTSMLFFGTNGVLAAWSLDQGVATYGLGYAAAAFIALIFGYTAMMKRLQRLDFLTFTSQPLSESERDRFVSGRAKAEPTEEAEDEEAEKQPEPVSAVAEGGASEDDPAKPA